MNSTLNNLDPKYKNGLLTFIFYCIYFLVAYILWLVLPSGVCAPGPNAILILVLPFVSGIFTVINLVKVYFNYNLVFSLLIHFLVLLTFLLLISN
jgi:hypothetical protein